MTPKEKTLIMKPGCHEAKPLAALLRFREQETMQQPTARRRAAAEARNFCPLSPFCFISRLQQRQGIDMRVTLLASLLIAALAFPAEAAVHPVKGVVHGTATAAKGVVRGTVTAAKGVGRGALCVISLGTRC
jgi:hypothetical protein